MPPGSFIPNIGRTSFNPYDYIGVTASLVPHDDGVTWSLVDNNHGVIQQILVPNPESANGQQSTQAQSGSYQAGTACGAVSIHQQTPQGSAQQPSSQPIPQGSATQQSHQQNLAQP